MILMNIISKSWWIENVLDWTNERLKRHWKDIEMTLKWQEMKWMEKKTDFSRKKPNLELTSWNLLQPIYRKQFLLYVKFIYKKIKNLF